MGLVSMKLLSVTGFALATSTMRSVDLMAAIAAFRHQTVKTAMGSNAIAMTQDLQIVQVR